MIEKYSVLLMIDFVLLGSILKVLITFRVQNVVLHTKILRRNAV